MLRTFLFDFSGTIVDDIHASVFATNYAVKMLSRPAVRLSYQEVVVRLRKYFEASLQRPSISKSKRLAIERFEEAYFSQIDSIRPFNDAISTLIMLRRNRLRTGIVSNTPCNLMKTVLEKHKMRRLFDTVIGLEDCRYPKPSPQPIKLGIKRLKTSPKKAAYVGDMCEDIKAAQAAGVVPIAVWRRKGHYESLKDLKRCSPTVIRQLTELKLFVSEKSQWLMN